MKIVNRCPLCAKRPQFVYDSKDRMLGVEGKFRVFRCTSCGLLFLSPMPTISELSRYYPPSAYYAYAKNDGKGLFQRIREYLLTRYYEPTVISRALTLVLHNVPAIPKRVQNGKVLDVGCGTGDTLIMLKRLGWDVYGMDMDKRAVMIAKKRGVTHVRVGTYEDISRYPDNFFDAIRLYHVIEHLNDPKKCLRLLYKKLKKGGEVIVGTPNAASIVARVFRAYWYNLDSPRHVMVFRPSNLSRCIQEAGFSKTEIEFCSAGGFLGSIDYFLQEKTGSRWSLIHNPWLVMLVYPLEWLSDRFYAGDVFVARAIKPSGR